MRYQVIFWFGCLLLVSSVFCAGCGEYPDMEPTPTVSEPVSLYLRTQGKSVACTLEEVRTSTPCTSSCPKHDYLCLYDCWKQYLSAICYACITRRYEGLRDRSCLVP